MRWQTKRIDTIVISTQHRSDITQEEIHDNIIKHIINPVIPKDLIDSETKILINPTGRFVKGGPCSDTGLTGRKIIVDTYGGVGKHGGALSRAKILPRLIEPELMQQDILQKTL